MIPDDTDILVTHTPPVGFGDLCCTGVRAGCVELLNSVQRRIKPKYHIYGHIHEGVTSWWKETGEGHKIIEFVLVNDPFVLL